MKKIIIILNLILSSVALVGCGVDQNDKGQVEGGFSLIDGQLLKTCEADGNLLYTPDDAAFLKGCQYVKGVVYFQPHDEHESLASFHAHDLVAIEGELHIADSTSLKNLSGLDNLKQVSDDVFILYNEQLENIDALANLETAHNLLINSNPVLTHVELTNFKFLAGEMQINANDFLEFIKLPNLEQAHRIGISSNSELIRLDFQSLLHVEEEVSVWNPSVDDYGTLNAFIE